MTRQRKLMVAGWWLIAAWCLCSPVEAQVPHLINYQGQLTDSQGVPLEGPYTLKFRLYDAATGGTKTWEETQTSVSISKGSFSVLLGSVASLDAVNWGAPCWLSIRVNSDPELAPRQRITSVPLAIRAETAEVVKTSGLTDDANRLVPSGAIILWDGGSCPAGYSRLASYDDKFLVAASTAGTTGGSNTHDHGAITGSTALTVTQLPSHTHSTPAHTHNIATYAGNYDQYGVAAGQMISYQNGQVAFRAAVSTGNPPGTPDGGGITGATGDNAGHTHTIAPADSRPTFKTILLCKKG